MRKNKISSNDELRYLLEKSLFLIRNYDNLINSYVLDFYVNNHWNTLSNSWRKSLEGVNPDELTYLLGSDRTTRVWPLSLLALRAVNYALCIPRAVSEEDNTENESFTCNELWGGNQKVKNIFTKCVKPKKQHEIERMANVCSKTAQECNVQYIVDFGAGLGHLARTLSYGYGLKVCCLEMQDQLNEQAKVIDQQVETTLQKHTNINVSPPVHITWKLTKDVTTTEFTQCIKTAFGIKDKEFSFGIVGLHPCGDLAVILTKLFLNCKEAKFLNQIGCCYMKLTTQNDSSSYTGYPLSKYLQNIEKKFTNLSYESREIACHAIEMYRDRLQTGNYEYLKVHSYRAALERIIVKNHPELKHYGLRSVKHTPHLNFDEYSRKAVKNLNIPLLDDDIHTEITKSDLNRWKEVVIFYTLRLMLAPLVESIILLDRLLHLQENNCDARIQAIFNPTLSPRNQITIATKL